MNKYVSPVGAPAINTTTFGIMTLSIKGLFATLSITTILYYDECL
jgi:hypothetical protein